VITRSVIFSLPRFWYFVTHEMGLAKIYPYTKFEISSFTRFRFTEGDLKFKNSTLDPDHALLGYFVTHEMGLAKIYPYTKFEVFSFTRFRLTEGGLKFNFGPWTLATPFGGILSC